MRDFFKRLDWIKVSIYFVSTLFLFYLIFICFFAKPGQFLIGNVFIKTTAIDFGGFGSLLAGIFSPLAFLWLILNFKQQNENLKIAEKQLSILMEEKSNRRRALKASLSINSVNIEGYCLNDDSITIQFCFRTDTDLIDGCLNPAYLHPFSQIRSAIPLIPMRSIFLSSTRQLIPKNQNIFALIKMKKDCFKSGSLNTWNLYINYYDADGFEQSNNLILIVSLNNPNSNMAEDYNLDIKEIN